MTKPLPIGIFKKKELVTLEIMNEIVKKYDPNDKIGHIFEVDIDFSEYDNSRKKICNEVFPAYSNLRVKFLSIIEAFTSFSLQCILVKKITF